MVYKFGCGHEAESKYKPSEYITKCPSCYYAWKNSLTTEQVREMRQAKADRKAERLDGWAAKREQKAKSQLDSYPTVRHDIAFNTQPGHIPFRSRMIKADDRAYESLNIAKKMRERAERLTSGVKVKGDAERRRQARRDILDKYIKVGSKVQEGFFGFGIVQRVNKKTYTIKFDSGSVYAREKTFVSPLEYTKEME